MSENIKSQNQEESEKLKICSNKGFHITFKNGWTISVQFGAGNYCDNHDASFSSYGKEPSESNNAEVWCWNDKIHYPKEPLGHQYPEDILKIMNKISKRKT
jgi:alanine dehydrogenase